MDKITIERETLERAIADYDSAAGNDGTLLSWNRARDNLLALLRAAQPAEAGMVYPPKPPPRHCGYIPDGSGVEWNAYDTMQMEAYARMAYAAGFAAGFAAAQPAPAAVPLTDEQIDALMSAANLSIVPEGWTVDAWVVHRVARAVERAHGIAAAGDKP